VIRLTWQQVTARSTDLALAVRRLLRACGQ
jgi:hypothetical protein